MGVVNVLTAVVLLSAIANLTVFFKDGVPPTPLAILTPGFLIPSAMLIVGAELVRRKSWGRTGLLAVIYFTLISAAFFLAQTFMAVSAGGDTSVLFGVDFFLQLLKTYKIEMADTLKAIILVGTVAVFAAGVAFVVLKHLFSEDVIDAFGGEDLWFERELRVGGLDTKPWIIVLLLVALSLIDLAPGKMPAAAAKPAVQSVTDLAATLQKDFKKEAEEKKKKEEAEIFERQKAEDRQRVSYAAFTQTNNGLWVVLSTGRLVFYEFSNYQAKTFNFKNYLPGSEFLLSPNGRHFYSLLSNQIIRVDTKEPLAGAVFSAARIFLGFANNGHYLIYAKDKTALQMIHIETGAKIFEIPMGLKLAPEDVTWNPSRTLAFFKFSDKDYVFMNTLKGKIQHQKIEFRFPEIVLDDLHAKSVLVGGPVGFTKEYKTYLIDPATLTAKPLTTNKKIVGLHPKSDALLSAENFSLTFIDRATFKDANPLKMEYRRFVPVPGTETMAVVEDQATHLKLLDLATGLKSNLSGPYQTGRGVTPTSCYLASSLGGHLLFTSCWKQGEIFWVSTLQGPKVQSWRFILPFEDSPAGPSPLPSPAASPSPSPAP